MAFKTSHIAGSINILDDYFEELLESGTLDLPSILSLGKAIDFIEEIGINPIEAYILELTQYLITRLKIYGL